MGSTTTIPVSEYLVTTYRPDCDYVDGEVQERNLGEYDHARIQLSWERFFSANPPNGAFVLPLNCAFR
jgi:hypothetical protein